MTHKANELLLTGASGFLGQYVLTALLADPTVRCRILLRPPISDSSARLERCLADLGLNLAALIADDRVVPIEGELPDRLNAAAFGGVDTVLHAAGNTAFHSNGSGEPTRTNVDGTRAMLTMAADAGISHFVFVSTAYTCGDQTGRLPEAFCPTRPPVRNDYERSKWEAERLVWQWSEPSRIATICRPSILFGDSQTGRASAMKGLYLVARATEILARAMDSSDTADRHHIPLRILGRGDATCNVVPIDWAARKIAQIALAPAAESAVHHITNADPPTHEEVKQWLEGYFDIGGGRFSDATWPLSDANHYEDLFYSLGNICLDYFRHGLTFESRCAAQVPAGQRLVDRASFFRCVRYAQSTNWGRLQHAPRGSTPPTERIDPRWYFEEFLPTAVPRSTISRVESLTATVQYTITNRTNRSWVGRFDQGQLAEMHRMPAALSPEFEYRLTYDDFENVVTCRKPLQEVFFHGSAEMFGDVEQALKMVPVMGEFLKEFPVDAASGAPIAC